MGTPLENFHQYRVIANQKKSAAKQRTGSQATNPKPAVPVNRGDGDIMAQRAEAVGMGDIVEAAEHGGRGEGLAAPRGHAAR